MTSVTEVRLVRAVKGEVCYSYNIEAGKNGDGSESGNIGHKVKAVTALRLHGKNGDGSESGNIGHKVKAVTALRLHGKNGDGGESGNIGHKVNVVTALRLVRTETAVRGVT